MAIYDVNGNELSACYDVNGNALTNAYDVNGNSIWTAEDTFAEKTYHYTLPEALTYAYGKMMDGYSADTSAFILQTDNHDSLSGSRASFLDYVGSYVDWSNVWMIDLGDTTNIHSASEVTAQESDVYTAISDKMDSAGVPDNRKIMVAGNHDMGVKPSDSDSYALIDHSWLLSGYFANSAATHYHDMDFVTVDSAHGIKYVSIGAWDYSEGEGYNNYHITSEHMESIISMLSVVDDYDIVLVPHCPPFSAYTNVNVYNSDLDGEVTHSDSTTTTGTSRISTDCTIDSLLVGRSEHTTGTVTDSDGTSHSFDFTGCNGRILCALSGHYHNDRYWYDATGGILSYVFDGYNYGTSPDLYPCYMGLIDTANESLKLWKVCNNGVVFAYEMPFRDAE